MSSPNTSNSEQLLNYLNDFIELDSNGCDPTDEQIELYETSLLIAQHLDKNTSLDDFKNIIKKEKLQDKMTCTLVTDFDHGEELKMIPLVNNLNGIYRENMNAPIPITRDWQKEMNTFYTAFSNPVNAYQFTLNMNM